MVSPGASLLVLRRADAWKVAIVATLAMSVSYIDRQTLAAIAPTVRKALLIDAEQYGWLTGAFSMAYLVGAPLSGALIDRVGARRGLTAALLVWSVVSGFHALTSSFVMLFALRIALGAAEAPSFPGAAQTVRRVLPRGDRSSGFGLLFTGSSIGSMIAAPLAIKLNAAWGWRGAFIGTAMAGLAWLPLWLQTTRRPALRVMLGPARAPEDGDAKATSRGALLVSAPVLRAVVLVVASAPSIMFVLNWYPQFMVEARGITQDGLARYLWVPPLFFDLGAVGFGVLASRRDRRSPDAVRTHWPLMLTAAVLASSLVLVPHVHGAWGAILLASASLAGGGAMFALLTADMLARVSLPHVSMAGGMTAAAQSLAYVIANPIVGRVVKRSGSYDGVLLVLGALVLPGAIAWALWPMSQRDGAPSSRASETGGSAAT
jgi:predicted MFS family arabinose efflux permease